jgi:uncharacterized protein YneF (UPF0154 family)
MVAMVGTPASLQIGLAVGILLGRKLQDKEKIPEKPS